MASNPFLSAIKKYKKKMALIKEAVDKAPEEWGKYQSDFNFEVTGAFRELMDFEKECFLRGEEDTVYKLKQIFTKNLRDDFVYGDYIRWSLEKPHGYAGDFKIIEDIYINKPKTSGFARLFDNYFMMSSISVAVRNRKDDFKDYLIELLNEKKGKKVRILDLGAGPAREVVELFNPIPLFNKEEIVVDFLDNDQRALDYCASKLRGYVEANFLKENVVRLALKKDITQVLPEKYDCIYSTGLFDYFDDRLTRRLLSNLKGILKDDGRMIISDVRDKYSNSSVHFMEWVGDWNLYYRDDEVFRQLFVDAGFQKENLHINFEQQGILQYIKAFKV
jgi:SAM-dependent methyltransferase